MVEVSETLEAAEPCILEACLDTGGGCNLVRSDSLPINVSVRPLKSAPKVSAAQGQALSIKGFVKLYLRIGDQKTTNPVEFLVVETLVVPLLLGTPWIDTHVLQIEPRTHEVLLEFPGSPPSRVPLTNSDITVPIRVAVPCVLPAFSETLIEVSTNRSGLSLLRPSRQRTGYVQVKNGLATLPVAGHVFKCWVANFSNRPTVLRKGHVVGIAESQEPSNICAVPIERGPVSVSTDWEETIRMASGHLSTEEREELLKTLRQHSELWDGHLGNISAVEHHIPTEGPPIASQPYRVGPAAREMIERELDRMKELDVVEPAKGPWASPVVLIPKPDGSIRFCVDYRKVNSVTTKDSYALPRIDDSLDSLGGAQYFSTLDANSGYWQIKVAPEDQDKTAFTTHRGLYKFKRLPFGLVSAPATFQRAIDVILSSVRFQSALTYLDDIIVYSSTFEQHMKDLNRVLTLLKAAGVTLKFSKCEFAGSEVSYLGYRVGREGLRVDQSKISSLQAAIAPNTKTGIRRFLGMCGVYRRFIPNYSKISSALTKYLKGEVADSFTLDANALNSHSELKAAITSAPILSLPRANGLYVLEADASASQLGVQLLQEQPDKTFRPIGFWSRQCNQAECNYSPTEREALAIVWGVRICKPYLEYKRFRVHSDHHALRWLFSVSISESNPRLVRWRLALSAYDFEVVYKPGPQQRVADELSRMHTSQYALMPAEEDEEGTIPCLVVQQIDQVLVPSPTVPRCIPLLKPFEAADAISLEELSKEQAADFWCQDMLRVLDETAGTPTIQEFEWDANGILSCRVTARADAPLRWLAPAKLRERILTLGHFAPIAAHPGSTRMYQTLARKWYWPSLARDCAAIVRRCPTCAARQLKRGPKRTTPMVIFPPEGALEFISMDVLGPLPISRRGNRYILVMTDRFSKITVAVAMADQTASTVAQAFVDRWLACYGIPIVILTDNGSNFASKFMSVVTNMLGIKHVYTSAYRPSTNGQVERFNATLADSLAILSSSDKDWDNAIGIACHAYNGSVHSSTGFAPFELACTREPAVAAWTSQPSFAKPNRDGKPMFRHRLLARVQRLTEAARETNSLRIQRYKSLYDAKVRARGAVFPGDSVLVKTFLLEPGRSPKLTFPVAGPYPVVQLDGVTVVIRTADGDQRVHLDRVIKCPMDLPKGVEFATDHPPRSSHLPTAADELSDIEYVIDRLVNHLPNDDGDGYLLRVRWAGYDRSADTWEPAAALPAQMLRSYERRKKLKSGELSGIPSVQ